MGPRGTFAVVIVNFGSHDLIASNVGRDLVGVGAAVYVVDNPSTPAERRAVADLCGRRGWTLVPSPRNDGFGVGVNRGVRAALVDGFDVFVLLNPDASAGAPVLAELARAVRRGNGAVVAPRVVDSSGGVEFSGRTVSLRRGRNRSGWSPQDDDPEWANWVTGACMAFDGGTFRDLDGFDPSYFMYWEDVDFSRRAVAAGRSLVVREDLTVRHDEGGTHKRGGGRSKSHLYYYWNCRNRLLFGRRFRRVSWARWLWATPRESWLILLQGGRRQILRDPGTLLAAVRGTVAGLLVASARAATPVGARRDKVV